MAFRTIQNLSIYISHQIYILAILDFSIALTDFFICNLFFRNYISKIIKSKLGFWYVMMLILLFIYYSSSRNSNTDMATKSLLLREMV